MIGERSKKLKVFKGKVGLPSWKDIQDLDSKGLSVEVERKVRLMKDYASAQRVLMQTVLASDVRVADALNNLVDLQSKLWDLEQRLLERGVNPLTDKDYMKARELLSKEVQFINKQKLDVATFQHNVSKAKGVTGDDDEFVVEVNDSE